MTLIDTAHDFSSFTELSFKPRWVPTARKAPARANYKAPVNNAPYLDAWARIRSFGGLSSGWKGPGSQPVPQQSIDDAEAFTKATFTARTAAPTYIGAAADGELIISWRGPERFIEASFHGDGSFSYYAKIGEKVEHFGDDVPAAQGLAMQLRNFIDINER